MHNSQGDHTSRTKRIEELEDLLVETERQLIDLHQAGEVAELAVPPPPPPPVAHSRSSTTASFGAAEMWLRIGGIAMVVASAIFFVSTAIHRGWIGPSAQLSLATLASLSFIALSFRFTSERRPWSVATAIGGASSLFVSGVVGFVGLDLLSLPVAIGWFIASALTFLALARVHDAQSLVIASTPAALIGLVLLSVDDGLAPSGLALLAAGYLVAVSLSCHLRGWMLARSIGVSLGAGTAGIGLLLAIVEDASSTAVLTTAVVIMSAVALAVISQSLEFARFERLVTEGSMSMRMSALVEARAIALAIPWTSLLTAIAIEHLAITELDVMWTASALAVGLGLLVAMTPRIFPPTMQLLHGVAAMATVTIGFATLLRGPVLLVALLGQAVAAAIVAIRYRSSETIIAATVLATAVLAITVGLLFHGSFVSGFNLAESAAVAAVVVVVGIAAWLLKENEVWADSWSLPWILVLGWAAATFRDVPQGQMAVTLIWALTGASMVYAGASVQRRHVVAAGLLTLAVTAGKLVFVDLATVDVLWRAGLFFAVGAVFLRLGFVLPGLLAGQPRPDDDIDDDTAETSSVAVGVR